MPSDTNCCRITKTLRPRPKVCSCCARKCRVDCTSSEEQHKLNLRLPGCFVLGEEFDRDGFSNVEDFYSYCTTEISKAVQDISQMNDALRNYLLGTPLTVDEECLLFGGGSSLEDGSTQSRDSMMDSASLRSSNIVFLKSQLESTLESVNKYESQGTTNIVKQLKEELARSQAVMEQQRAEISRLNEKLSDVDFSGIDPRCS